MIPEHRGEPPRVAEEGGEPGQGVLTHEAPRTPPAVGPTPASGGLALRAIAGIVASVVLLAAAFGAGIYVLKQSVPGTGSSSSSPPTTVASGAPSSAEVAAVAAKVDPAVVDITTTLSGGGTAVGTGMVLSSSGLVLTNNHVIEMATSVNAQVGGTGRTYTATVLGYSVADDVALLQLNNASGLRVVTTGNSANLTVGQSVVAVGNAGGKGGTPSAAGGSITALNQTITAGDPGTLTETLHDMIQTDAPIVPGDSGGPLTNTGAAVIGMNTAASVTNSGGFGVQSGAAANVSYAIGIDEALAVAHQIESGQATSTVHIGPRAFLGVVATDAPNGAGAYIQRVVTGSPAATAGLAAGDTVVSVGGAPISSAGDLTDDLSGYHPGDSVTIAWTDASGIGHSASVTLASGPPA